ncbi:MAG TPA: SOS response-associated peptidase [Acidimicrobiales bacterium]|nr:SOS response-associated peptidase [Acidimicrobiales bacterium]
MCGRIALYSPPARLARELDAQLEASVNPDAEPSWNIAPSLDILAVRAPRPDPDAPPKTGEHPQREISALLWGLVPYWAKSPTIGNRIINLRSETLTEKASFKGILERHRCLVLADGFYEWRHPPGTRKRGIPFFFQRSDGEPMTFAGLWDTWRDRTRLDDPDAVLRTCTIITTAANKDVSDIHDRMPVLVEERDIDRWLDRYEKDPAHILDILAPSKAGVLMRHPVSREVNNPDNDGPELIEPVPDEEPQPEGLQSERLF